MNDLMHVQRKAKVQLDFTAPEQGTHRYTLYFMCDSYAGCDQEYEMELSIKEGEEEDSSSEEESDESGGEMSE